MFYRKDTREHKGIHKIRLGNRATGFVISSMSVDFPSSYPPNTPPASKPLDVQTLQETFATLLRNFGTEKGGSQTNTLLEVLRPTDDAKENDRIQQRHDQRQVEREDFSQINRKLQNKSEVRSSEMSADYHSRLNRQETLKNDYRDKAERSALSPPTGQPDSTASVTTATSPQNVLQPNESLPNHTPPQQSNVANIAVSNNPSGAAAVASPSSPASSGQANVVIPATINQSAMPMQMPPQSVPLQTVTVFTPSGRFGNPQEKSDDNDDEKEERDEEKIEKKKQPFAVFEAIRVETTRPIRQKPLRQPLEPTSQSEIQQITGKPREKPKEKEAEPIRNVKTMEEFLNTSPQNLVVPKKGESDKPNPMRYLNRIAAACEAAAQFAPIRLKINLDHLGTLALRFYYKSDRMSLRFETPSKESAQFLHDHLENLKAILLKRNVKIVDIELYVGEPED